VVRGLNTAASIWLTAALGMACGAGLVLLAVATTLAHFTIMLGFPKLVGRLPRSRRLATEIRISYDDSRELLRTILIRCTELRFAISHVRLDREEPLIDSREEAEDMADYEGREVDRPANRGRVTLYMQVKGKRPVSQLIAALSDIPGIREVGAVSEDDELE
jgi:putative Mg2+ transporter-C (MgtC) family protein